MASSSGGKIPLKDSLKLIVEGESKEKVIAPKYADLLKPKPYVHENVKVNPKPVVMLHGEPSITWKAQKVQNMIIHENF